MQYLATFDLEARLLTVTDNEGRLSLQTRLDVGELFTDALNPHGLTLKPGTVWQHNLGSRHMGAELVRADENKIADVPLVYSDPKLNRPVSVAGGSLLALLLDFANHEVNHFAHGVDLQGANEAARDAAVDRRKRAISLLADRGLELFA
jgi:hypothetical protein